MDIYVEEWKPVFGFEGFYEISNLGVVKSLDRIIKMSIGNRFLKGKYIGQKVNNNGYFGLVLSRENVKTFALLHRLLAKAFIPNTENKPFVNHINGVKTDNRLENLEWVTHSENMQHAYKMGLCCVPEKRKVKVYDICTGKEFPTIKAASVHYSINYSTCKNMLHGHVKNKTCLRLRA